MINLAVLITCHNRRAKTIKCLKALFNQADTKNIRIKVFLVDDGSTDKTSNEVMALFPEVVIIQGDGNLFWARGVALAWKESLKSKEIFDYYLWLNDDTFLYNTAIKQLLDNQIDKNDIIRELNFDLGGKKCRELYGIVDFIIARDSNYFIGCDWSSFSLLIYNNHIFRNKKTKLLNLWKNCIK